MTNNICNFVRREPTESELVLIHVSKRKNEKSQAYRNADIVIVKLTKYEFYILVNKLTGQVDIIIDSLELHKFSTHHKTTSVLYINDAHK